MLMDLLTSLCFKCSLNKKYSAKIVAKDLGSCFCKGNYCSQILGILSLQSVFLPLMDVDGFVDLFVFQVLLKQEILCKDCSQGFGILFLQRQLLYPNSWDPVFAISVFAFNGC